MRCNDVVAWLCCFAAAAVICPSTCVARDRRATAETRIWRVTDTENGAVYFAQSIQARWSGRAGLMATASGTVTFTPSQGQGDKMAHVGFADAWRAPFSVPGTDATYKGSVSGWAALASDGAGGVKPMEQVPEGLGYESVTFRDIQSKKPVTVKKFSADAVKAGDVPGLVPKRR